jgi:bifunctional non-homologous end joining protein LigD
LTLKALLVAKCPFENLPEKRASRWGESFTAEKMEQCRWVNPKPGCQVTFLEWEASGISVIALS